MKSYQQLDSKAFDRYFSGIGHARSVTLYLKTATIFLRSFDEKLVELASHLEADRTRDAIVIAHRLKGSLLTLGGNALAEVFRRIEEQLNEQNHSEFLALLKRQDRSIPLFISELRDWTEQLEASVQTEQKA